MKTTQNFITHAVLQDLILNLKIGIYPEEQEKSQMVLVNVKIDFIAQNHLKILNINETCNYKEVYHFFKDFEKNSHINMIEEFIWHSLCFIFSNPMNQSVEITVLKLHVLNNVNVGISCQMDRSSWEEECKRLQSIENI